MTNPILLWFKNDLRLHDNEALFNAINSRRPILPLYIFDTSVYRILDLGFPKTDTVRFEFTKQCVANLKKNFKSINGDLMIRAGDPSTIISELVEKYTIESIYAEQEFATEELNLIESIRQKLPNNCTFNFYWGRTLYHIDDIPYAVEKIPATSKTFRINTAKATNPRKTFEAPKKINLFKDENLNWGELPEQRQLGFSEDKNFALTYMEGGETKALERLNYYFFETEHLTNYRWTRNRSLGLDYSSKFSPYMALGCISPRKIHEAVKEYEATIKRNQSTWWLIFEIVWRDYFTFKLMRHQNKVYHTEGYTKKTIEFTNNKELYKRWCEGKTGIPFVDAHMRQLNQTGFMSNRGRVNCSSFLVHDYKIDWTWGASYFESKLIDYDVASNWINWHYQTYQIWYTNPVNQAHKYKAKEFIRKWVPELRELDDVAILIPWEHDVKDYPKPHEIFSKWNRAINKINNGSK